MTDHQKIILDLLVKATSTAPMIARDLREKCGMSESDFDATLDALYQNKIINRCYMTKGGWTDNVYWPTAKALQPFFNGRLVTGEAHKLASVPRRNEIKQQIVFPLIATKGATPVAEISKSRLIKSIIDKTPGIEHDELMLQLVGDTKDDIKIRRAQDLIQYVLKKGEYIKRNHMRITDGAAVKCYYKDSDYASLGEKKESANIQPITDARNTNEIINALSKIEAPRMNINLIKSTSALQTQEGGSHYKNMAIQPVEYITANNIGFVEGSIIKYVSRYKNKNGVQDLKKARHFLDILIELQAVNHA